MSISKAATEQFDFRTGYLNTASSGLPPKSVLDAMNAAMESWSKGLSGPDQWDAAVNESRSLFAQIVKAPTDWVAVGGHVSSMAGLVASSLPAGSNVLMMEGDFTSLMFPFLVAQQRGINVQIVAPDSLTNSITSETDWVAASLVQSSDGAVLNEAELVRRCEETGTHTFIDATQAVGWYPFDATRFDITATGAYKWLLCPRGIAFLTVKPECWAGLLPLSAGWYAGEEIRDSYYGSPLRLAKNARQYDLSPSWVCWEAAVPALRLIAAEGTDVILAHNLSLANRFRAHLGLPAGDSAIVSVDLPPKSGEMLRAAGIRCSQRAGKTRIACHLYNNDDDIMRLIDCVPKDISNLRADT